MQQDILGTTFFDGDQAQASAQREAA